MFTKFSATIWVLLAVLVAILASSIDQVASAMNNLLIELGCISAFCKTAVWLIPILLLLGGAIAYDVSRVLRNRISKRIPVSIFNPAIRIENKDGRDWKNCRIILQCLDNKITQARFCWSEDMATGQTQYECDCLNSTWIFINLESIKNQHELRTIVKADLTKPDFISGIHKLHFKFFASSIGGDAITRDVYVKVVFLNPYPMNKYTQVYGQVVEVKILEVK